MAEQGTHPVLERFRRAQQERAAIEGDLKDAYRFCRLGHFGVEVTKATHPDTYDGTAAKAVKRAAARLAQAIGFGFADMFELKAVKGLTQALSEAQRAEVEKLLSSYTETVHEAWSNSNMLAELYPALRESLVSLGCLMAHAGDQATPIRWEAVRLDKVYVSLGAKGLPENTYRVFHRTPAQIAELWPGGTVSREARDKASDDDTAKVVVVEAVERDFAKATWRRVVVEEETGHEVFSEDRRTSPWVPFRVAKLAGAAYGSGPVLDALPDIRTLDKATELMLRNAAISITGMWQAEDDGVLDPANIQLVPGAIIPKASGSSGLTPLDPPGRFDLTQFVIEDRREQIRQDIEGPGLPALDAPVRSATEVAIRNKETAILLAPDYHNLFLELVIPAAVLTVEIMTSLGLFENIGVVGGGVYVAPRGPFKDLVAVAAAANKIQGVQMAAALDPTAARASVKIEDGVRAILKAYGWKDHELNSETQVRQQMQQAQETHAARMQQDPEYAQQVQADKKGQLA